MERISVYKVISLIENGNEVYSDNHKDIKKVADIIDLFVELGANPYEGVEGVHTQQQFKYLFNHGVIKDLAYMGVDKDGDTGFTNYEEDFKHCEGIKVNTDRLMRVFYNTSLLERRYKTVGIYT